MSLQNPFDTLGKRTVREQWNTPLLRILNEGHGFRFRYMVLPGVDLLDVKLWRDMIDEVVAFEVRARRTRNDPEGRRHIVALRRNLQLLGIPGQAFFGPMEEVVILRRDYDGNHYDQKKVITLYNLDFCDELASRIDTTEQGKQVWRFEAIRQILRDQQQAFQELGGPGFFVILLTVRDQMDSQKLQGFLSGSLYEDTRAYLDVCGGIESLPPEGFVLGSYTWALKAFIHNTLRQYLTNPHISAMFFPLVRYLGTPLRQGIESPMLHCMVICRFDELQAPYPSYIPGDYLSCISSVTATDEEMLAWDPQPGEPTTPEGQPSPFTLFQDLGLSFLNGSAH